MKHLTDRDYEVLEELDAAVRNHRNVGAGDYVRPLDCGGFNGSDHSYRLAKLERKGLANSRQRSAFGSRGSKEYTITEEGLRLIKRQVGKQ